MEYWVKKNDVMKNNFTACISIRRPNAKENSLKATGVLVKMRRKFLRGGVRAHGYLSRVVEYISEPEQTIIRVSRR